MPQVIMYSTRTCPYCVRAERLLTNKSVKVEKILIDRDPSLMRTIIEKTGRRTVPQIFIGNHHVGGYDDLVELDLDGELDILLQAD